MGLVVKTHKGTVAVPRAVGAPRPRNHDLTQVKDPLSPTSKQRFPHDDNDAGPGAGIQGQQRIQYNAQ